MKSKLAVPVVNNNGNTKQSLLDEIMECRGRLTETIEKMCAAEYVHGRNFQTIRDSGYTHKLCVEQHRERIHRLTEVSSELFELAMAISEQGRK